MYMELYDESKDLCERIANFKNKSNTLLERYTNGAAQHYQYENAIMAYLWLRYPDKYYIYKFSEVKAVSSELESDYRFKKGAYVDNIRNFMALYDEICAAFFVIGTRKIQQMFLFMLNLKKMMDSNTGS